MRPVVIFGLNPFELNLLKVIILDKIWFGQGFIEDLERKETQLKKPTNNGSGVCKFRALLLFWALKSKLIKSLFWPNSGT
jgi:hypothetical protein